LEDLVMQRIQFQRAAALGTMLACVFLASSAMAEDVESGTFSLEIWRVSFVGSAAHATGVLNYGGKSYDIKATGLGIGGFGASKTTISGTVYNMEKREDFAGAYANVRSGIAVGDKDMAKSIFVQNDKGVRIKGKPETTGVQLNLGADGFVVSFAD
jgi:hypothetical protein